MCPSYYVLIVIARFRRGDPKTLTAIFSRTRILVIFLRETGVRSDQNTTRHQKEQTQHKNTLAPASQIPSHTVGSRSQQQQQGGTFRSSCCHHPPNHHPSLDQFIYLSSMVEYAKRPEVTVSTMVSNKVVLSMRTIRPSSHLPTGIGRDSNSSDLR